MGGASVVILAGKGSGSALISDWVCHAVHIESVCDPSGIRMCENLVASSSCLLSLFVLDRYIGVIRNSPNIGR